MPALVLPEFPDDSGHRCIRPPVAEYQSVRLSANKADSGSPTLHRTARISFIGEASDGLRLYAWSQTA